MKLNSKEMLEDVGVRAGTENWAQSIDRYDLGPMNNQSIGVGAIKMVSDQNTSRPIRCDGWG
jgi:hypothetical protein